jgi:hypothetical protein
MPTVKGLTSQTLLLFHRILRNCPEPLAEKLKAENSQNLLYLLICYQSAKTEDANFLFF